jgi:hypothetical protein
LRALYIKGRRECTDAHPDAEQQAKAQADGRRMAHAHAWRTAWSARVSLASRAQPCRGEIVAPHTHSSGHREREGRHLRPHRRAAPGSLCFPHGPSKRQGRRPAPLHRERAEGALVGARRAAHAFSARSAPTSTGARRGFLLRSAAAAGAAAAPHDQDGETREMRRSRPAAGLPRQRRSPAALTAARSGLGSTAGPTACAAYEVLGAFIHSRSNLAFICWHGEICPPESKSLHGAASAEKRGQRRSVGLCVRARGLLLALTCSTLLATHTGQSQALRLGAGAAAN